MDTLTLPRSPLGEDFEVATLKHEIVRLQRILRDASLPEVERVIAEDQLTYFLETLNQTTEAN